MDKTLRQILRAAFRDLKYEISRAPEHQEYDIIESEVEQTAKEIESLPPQQAVSDEEIEAAVSALPEQGADPIEIPENVKLAEAENPYLHELNELARSFGIYEGLPYLQFASRVEKIIRLSPTTKQLADLNRLVDSIAKSQQGYTREQIIGALEKGKSISDDCWPGTIGPYQYQKEEKLKDDYLSSLTHVAVEAERTERWISTRDRWPEIGSLIVFVRDIDEPQYIAGVWTDEEQNWATMNRVILWTPLKPVTAEEVNNDKTK